MNEHDDDDLTEWARRLVADWPPVTAEQKAEIGAALRGGVMRAKLEDPSFALAS